MSEASELGELSPILDTIEAQDPDLSVIVVDFIKDELYDPDEPETWTLALQYAKWVMTRAEIALKDDVTKVKRDHPFCKVCYKNTGWLLSDEGCRPCDKCRPDRVTKWQAVFVDDNGPPR